MHSDTLARVSLYLLSQPSSEFSSLVAPLLTPESIPNTALVILLDWSQPHLWLRQMCQWISLFRIVVQKLGNKQHAEMEEVVESWKHRGRGGGSTNLDGTPSAAGVAGEADTALPLGPGEWTDPLGLPICVVCQNVSFSTWRIRANGNTDLLKRPNEWKFLRRAMAGRNPISILCYSI